MSASPFVIWTLQRTGGSNLTQCLVEQAGLPKLQHEPFNPGRVHGTITQEWRKQPDQALLDARMAEVCSRPAVIKHCVELVPWQVSIALARAATAAGFKHMFLYRRQRIDRMLSRYFAQQSGIWGPRLASAAEVDDAIFAQPLPVAEMVTHEQRSSERLQQVWDALLALGQRPQALAFEEVYLVDRAEASRTLLALLDTLGLPIADSATEPFISSVLHQGDQGTRQSYARFQGIDALAQALEKIPAFNPHLPASTP